MAEVHYASFMGVPALTSAAPLDFMKGDPLSAAYVSTSLQAGYLQDRGILLDQGIVLPKQVHGDVIWRVTAGDASRSGLVEADAVVTDVPGLPLAVRTADCLPALLYDPVRRVIAAVHAGWKSTRLDILTKTVGLLRTAYDVDPQNIRVAIGPCIRRAACEVGPEFMDYFPQDTVKTDAGFRFDIAGANIRQLLHSGVKSGNIFDSGLCTFSDAARFHSFRRDADRSGRILSVIVMA
ncbi:MAG: peptidoglycan editing factor PgeF [Candidatus Omnitrophota bacterium]